MSFPITSSGAVAASSATAVINNALNAARLSAARNSPKYWEHESSIYNDIWAIIFATIITFFIGVALHLLGWL